MSPLKLIFNGFFFLFPRDWIYFSLPPPSWAPSQPHTLSTMAFFSRPITVEDTGLRLPWKPAGLWLGEAAARCKVRRWLLTPCSVPLLISSLYQLPGPAEYNEFQKTCIKQRTLCVCACAAKGGVTVMLILQPACSNCLAFFFFFHPLKCMCLSEKWSFELLPQFWPVRHPVALARHVLDSQPRSLMLYVLSALHHLLCSVLEMLFVGCSFSSCWRGVRLWQTAALWKDLMGINSSKVRHLEFTCSQIKMLFHAHTFPHM